MKLAEAKVNSSDHEFEVRVTMADLEEVSMMLEKEQKSNDDYKIADASLAVSEAKETNCKLISTSLIWSVKFK